MVGVQGRAGALHTGKRPHQRQVDGVVYLTRARFVQRLGKGLYQRGHCSGLERQGLVGILFLGKHRAAIALHERGKAGRPVVGIDHVGGKRYIEQARIKRFPGRYPCGFCGIGREHHAEQRLGIGDGNGCFADHERDGLFRFIVAEKGGPIGTQVDGKGKPLIKEGCLGTATPGNGQMLVGKVRL